MATEKPKIFIIDCHVCKAKVAAKESGWAECFTYDGEAGQPYGTRVRVGNCSTCGAILVGESVQIDFELGNPDADRWSEIVRVYPKPPKSFSSWRIPRVVSDSLSEADRSLQAGAHIAACVMLGRALEALCLDILEPKSVKRQDTAQAASTKKKKPMLGERLKKLRDAKVIDDRLYDWSQHLHAFRILAAHPEDICISRGDAEDLQIFINAIVEYVYDVADRYKEFKNRAEARAKRKKS